MKTWVRVVMIISIVFIVLTILVAIIGISFDKALFFGRHLEAAKIQGIQKHDNFLKTPNGIIHTRMLYGAQNKKQPLAILYCHGNGGSVNSWSKDVKFLSNYGDVFLFDFTGFGYTPGTPTHKKVLNDSIQAYKHLTKEYGNNIIVWGRSLGAPMAVHIAVHFKPKSIVLEVPFTNTLSVIRNKIPLPGLGLFIKNRFDLKKQLKKMKLQNNSTKVICISAKNDIVIPLKQIKKLKDYFNEFYILPGGHSSILQKPEYYSTVNRILK